MKVDRDKCQTLEDVADQTLLNTRNGDKVAQRRKLVTFQNHQTKSAD